MKDIKFTEEIEQEFFHHQYTWHNFALWLKENHLPPTIDNLRKFRDMCWVLTVENEEDEIKVFTKKKQ